MTQGDPEATPLYCLTWHQYVRKAEATLSKVGGIARFISDDGYLVGPPRETTIAFNTFRQDIEQFCGLTLQANKCELFTRNGDKPEGCVSEVSLGGVMVDGSWEPGFVCVGVPVGTDEYVREMMRKKMTDLREEAARASRVLGEERQSLWTVLRSSTLHKLDYWLGTIYPSLITDAAQDMDSLLGQMLETVTGYEVPFEGAGEDNTILNPGISNLQGKTYQWWLTQLPIKSGGLGIRNQSYLMESMDGE